MDKKQETFILWLAESLGIKDSKELDMKIKNMGQDKLKKLTQYFETEIWPKLQNKINMAKQGSKLAYIQSLNGQCPEGYEVEKFMIGGKVCSRCKKKAETIKKNENVMDSVKEEIESKKCGGKAKKKTKKMQIGGVLTYDYQWNNSIFNPKNRIIKNIRPSLNTIATLMTSTPTNIFPDYEPYTLIVNKEILKETPKEKTKEVESTNKFSKKIDKDKTKEVKSNLGGGLYEYMIKNGFSDKEASYQGRKQLWNEIFGDKPYTGTAAQNTELLEALKTKATYKQISLGRLS